jgi:hypothetical protein
MSKHWLGGAFKMKWIGRAFEIRFWFLIWLAAFSVSLSAQTIETRNSRYYDLGKTAEAPLFTQHIIIETLGPDERNWDSEIKDDTGTVVIKETAHIKSNTVVSQLINNSQLQEACELQVGSENVVFRTYHFVDNKRGDLIEEKTREKEDNFITGPAVEFYLAQRWDQLSSGTAVKVQFGIFEIMRTIAFELKKEGETNQVLKVQMRPANFFIRLLVDPIHLDFDKVTKRLVHYSGRTPLRRNRDGKLKPWDAEIIYE